MIFTPISFFQEIGGLDPVADSFIWTGGTTVNSNTIDSRRYDLDGNLLQSIRIAPGTVVASIYSMIRSSDGNLYAGGDAVISKVNGNDGSSIWSNTYSFRFILSLARSNTNLYAGGVVFSTISIEKLDLDGNQIFTRNHGTTVRGIGADNLNNFYINGDRTSNITTRKYDSDGNLLWSRDHGADAAAGVQTLDLDSQSNVYTVGTRTSSITIRKYDTDGNLLFTRDHGANTVCVKVDNQDNFIIGGVRTSDITTRKYDSDGNLLWSRDHGGIVYGLNVDNQNNIYTVGVVSSSVTTRKYDSDGTLIWSVNHANQVYTTTPV